jgi:simple sugar transport system permease protein
MFGALIFGSVQVGLVLVGAPGYYFNTFVGITLVAAVLVNTWFTKYLSSSALGGRRTVHAKAGAGTAGGKQ